jgi:hypothetical protein
LAGKNIFEKNRFKLPFFVQGQYDIKKLKRENEMLKKEIWCLRDEYDKLDKLLKEKEYDFSSSSTTCSTSDSVRPDPAETNPSTSQS